MSNAIKGSIVDVKTEGKISFRGCVIARFDGDSGSKMLSVTDFDHGSFHIVYDCEVSDYLIKDVKKLEQEGIG